MTLKKKQETIRPFDSILKTTCGNCPAGCGMKFFLKDGEVVDLFGDEEHPANKGSLCPKGLSVRDHIANPHRLLLPRIRESLDEPFREVPWDEAVSFVSRKLEELIGQTGPDGIFIHGTPSAPFDYLAGATLFARHAGTANGPSRFFPRAFSPFGILHDMFGVPGSQLLMNTPRDWCNSRCIFLYGCNLAASDPVTMGFLIDARDRGTTLLAVDFRKTVTTARTTRALRIRPGTGGVLLKGILHFLIEKNFVDTEFIREYTDGFEELTSRVRTYTPEVVSNRCGIGIDEFLCTAEALGSQHPIQVIAGDWFSRQFLTDEELVLCGALVALKGSPGMAGGGLNLLATSPFSWIDVLSEDASPEAPAEPLHLESALLDPARPVGALFWQGNPFSTLTGGREVEAALHKVPLIVHFSLYPNGSFHHSHVSLPVASWWEHSGLLAASNGRSIQWQNKIVDPPGECRPAPDIWNRLAEALKPGFHLPCTDEVFADRCRCTADFFLKNNPLTSMVRSALLDPQTNPPGGILWPCTEAKDLEFETSRLIKGDVRGKNILFENGRNYPYSPHRFPTQTGKILLSPGVGDHPDSPEGETEDPDCPLLLCIGVFVDYVEDYGGFPADGEPGSPRRATLEMHPLLAKTLGVRGGDSVTVENGRGVFSAPVRLSVDVDPRTVWYPYGADEFQFSFHGFPASRLFPAQASGSPAPSSTRVVVYGANRDQRSAVASIRRFIESLETGSRT